MLLKPAKENTVKITEHTNEVIKAKFTHTIENPSIETLVTLMKQGYIVRIR